MPCNSTLPFRSAWPRLQNWNHHIIRHLAGEVVSWNHVQWLKFWPVLTATAAQMFPSFKHVEAPLGHRLVSLGRYILPAAVETLPAHAGGLPLRCGSCLGKIHPNVILRLRSDRLTVGDVFPFLKWGFIHLGGQELAHEEYAKINSTISYQHSRV